MDGEQKIVQTILDKISVVGKNAADLDFKNPQIHKLILNFKCSSYEISYCEQ